MVFDVRFELVFCDEVIVHAVFLPRARSARGGGNGHFKILIAAEQFF